LMKWARQRNCQRVAEYIHVYCHYQSIVAVKKSEKLCRNSTWKL